MPLIEENRLMVKKGFEMINTKRNSIAPALRQMLDRLNIKQIEAFHVGFLIAPRLNATGRMASAHDGLNSLLFSDIHKQRTQLEYMDRLNMERRATQELMVKEAMQLINFDDMILIGASEGFHEGIIGIVAGRLTEKYNKPTLIMGINREKGVATGSLRGPSYFNVIDMLKECGDLLIRFGGHAQAGGLTVSLDNLGKLNTKLKSYCSTIIDTDDIQKDIIVDTPLYPDELHVKTIDQIFEFGPHGEGNPEPQFLIDEVVIRNVDTVGKNGDGHLKLHCLSNDQRFTVMQRGKGGDVDEVIKDKPLQLIGKMKKDTYKGGFYVEGNCWI